MAFPAPPEPVTRQDISVLERRLQHAKTDQERRLIAEQLRKAVREVPTIAARESR